jgi:hypothetical protein
MNASFEAIKKRRFYRALNWLALRVIFTVVVLQFAM